MIVSIERASGGIEDVQEFSEEQLKTGFSRHKWAPSSVLCMEAFN